VISERCLGECDGRALTERVLCAEFEIDFTLRLSWDDDRVQWIDAMQPHESARCKSRCSGVEKCCDDLWRPRYSYPNGVVKHGPIREIPMIDRPHGMKATWDIEGRTAKVR
jgi:hypothetical protein